jgi:hypothetical protein
MKNRFSKISYIIISILTVLVAISVFIHTVPYFTYQPIGFLALKEKVRDLPWWKIGFYMHISVGVIILISGLLQFSTKLRKSKLELHRTLGKIYVFAVLFISAPGGLIMAFYATGGYLSSIAFIGLDLFWFYFTYKAYRFIKAKQIIQHQNFMIRSYSLTLAAVTLRLYIAISIIFLNVNFETSYIIISYLCWIPNIIIAEIYIRNRTKELL